MKWDEIETPREILPVLYKQRLLDQWQRLMQGNQSMAEYITESDEFLFRCDENESDIVFLSKFRSGLRESLRHELFVWDISTLEQVYQLVQDLDRFQYFSFTRRTDYKDNKATTVKSQPNQSQFQSHFGSSNSTQKHDDKSKGVYIESSRSVQHNGCFKYQKLDHIVAQCLSNTRTLIFETHSNNDQDGLEEIVHDSEGDVLDDELVVDQATTLGCLSSMHSPSIDDVDGDYSSV